MAHKAVPLSSLRLANKAQCAEFFDVTLPTVDAWIRRGAPVVQKGSRGVSWQLDLRAVAEWVYAPNGQPEGWLQDPDAMAPQDRKAWYDSETKRRELQVRDGELVPRAEVEQVVATAFAALQQDVLAIPDRLERQHGIRPDVAERVERGLHASLAAAADRLATLAPVEAPEVPA